MVRCPDIVDDGKYRNFGEVLGKLVDVVYQYKDCQARHNASVDYYEKDKK